MPVARTQAVHQTPSLASVDRQSAKLLVASIAPPVGCEQMWNEDLLLLGWSDYVEDTTSLEPQVSFSISWLNALWPVTDVRHPHRAVGTIDCVWQQQKIMKSLWWHLKSKITKMKLKIPQLLDCKYCMLCSSIAMMLYLNTVNHQFAYDDRYF